MKHRLLTPVLLLSLLLLLLCLAPASVFLPKSKAAHAAINPIQHIVFIVKENKTFDAYFGAYGNGVNGATTGKVKVNGVDKTIPLAPLVDSSATDYPHDWGSSHNANDKGAMDHFNQGTCSPAPYLCYQQATRANLPNYWSYADHFVLNDNAFSEVEGPSFPNHMMTVAASSGPALPQSAINNPLGAKVGNANQWGCDSPTGATVQLYSSPKQYPCFRGITTLPDELTAAGISWKYYAPQKGEGGYAWNALDPFVQDGPGTALFAQHDAEWSTFDSDVAAGTLPAFSWLVAPDKYSEHPFNNGNDSICSGENWTVSRLNAIMRSPVWASTVIVLTWDEFGGYYDHVVPPVVDGIGEGFRVPMLIISPFAQATDNAANPHVSHVHVDFASVLKLAEQVFGLPSLGGRDVTAGNLMTDLNTSRANPALPLALRTTCPY